MHINYTVHQLIQLSSANEKLTIKCTNSDGEINIKGGLSIGNIVSYSVFTYKIEFQFHFAKPPHVKIMCVRIHTQGL